MDDLISRQAAIDRLHPDEWGTPDEKWWPEREVGAFLQALPSVQQWIPVKMRPMTAEEWEEYEQEFGLIYDEDATMFDCPMPEDGQEILVSSQWGVWLDTCCVDGCDCGDIFGLETNGDWDGIDAWMPLPEPYKGVEE